MHTLRVGCGFFIDILIMVGGVINGFDFIDGISAKLPFINCGLVS